MEAVVRDVDGYVNVYWIKRSGSGIVGWFATKGLMDDFLGDVSGSSVDIHFTYPADGNLHFSLKAKTSTGVERYENAYFDYIKLKQITEGVPSTEVGAREELMQTWNSLMPQFRPSPLVDFAAKPLIFCFATTAFNVSQGRIIASAMNRLPRSVDPPHNSNAIDVTSIGSGAVNVTACLYGAGAASVGSTVGKTIWSIRDESRPPHIELMALCIPT